MNDLLVRAAKGEWTERPPVWLMRQAGRHLPEYRDVRATVSFKEAITTPSIAADLTLQPWDRYHLDGLVIFSDILPAIEPLGFEYRMEAGRGPVVLNPVETPEDVPTTAAPVESTLPYVAALLEEVDARVGHEVPLIGFAGGPFTLASYVVAAEPSPARHAIRQFRAEYPAAFRSLLSQFADVIRDHLRMQIDAGADLVQLFDTYAGVLSPSDYREFVLPLHQRIFRALDVPSIVFVRNMAGRLPLLDESGADVVGLDWTVEMRSARTELGSRPVQGNLDPATLFATPERITERTNAVIEAAGERGHILNLGHGVHKDTPIEGVEAFIAAARSIDRTTTDDR